MTLEQLNAKVREWDAKVGPPSSTSKYSTILDQLNYHAQKEWKKYLPATHPDFRSNYMDRLASWVGNVQDEADQQLLLEYALYISFFSHDDFTALYQAAMHREVVPWVAAMIGASLNSGGGDGFHKLVADQIDKRTWFCPITDSMDINEFYKVNHLKGVGNRPGFESLRLTAEADTINYNHQVGDHWRAYMANPTANPYLTTKRRPALERIVVLEDVVGSATQCSAALTWALNEFKKPLLFVPLILCPNGVKVLRDLETASNGLLTVSPVIELLRSDLLGPERQNLPSWPITPPMELLATQLAQRASPGIETFGYKNTGCSIVTFSNTPDNTIPLVHNQPPSGSWQPLFPRVYRD